MNKKFKINIDNIKKFNIYLPDFRFAQYFFTKNFRIKVIFTLEMLMDKFLLSTLSITNNITALFHLNSYPDSLVNTLINISSFAKLNVYPLGNFANKVIVGNSKRFLLRIGMKKTSLSEALYAKVSSSKIGSYLKLDSFDYTVGPPPVAILLEDVDYVDSTLVFLEDMDFQSFAL